MLRKKSNSSTSMPLGTSINMSFMAFVLLYQALISNSKIHNESYRIPFTWSLHSQISNGISSHIHNLCTSFCLRCNNHSGKRVHSWRHNWMDNRFRSITKLGLQARIFGSATNLVYTDAIYMWIPSFCCVLINSGS